MTTTEEGEILAGDDVVVIGVFDTDLAPDWKVGQEVENDLGHRFRVTDVDGTKVNRVYRGVRLD